jgi:uncharacterized protein
MKRDAALQILRGLRSQLEARGIVHAGLFGSVARDEADHISDIDVVMTPAADARLDLFDLGGFQTMLEEAFTGLEVDVVVEPINRDSLREAILRDRANAF